MNWRSKCTLGLFIFSKVSFSSFNRYKNVFIDIVAPCYWFRAFIRRLKREIRTLSIIFAFNKKCCSRLRIRNTFVIYKQWLCCALLYKSFLALFTSSVCFHKRFYYSCKFIFFNFTVPENSKNLEHLFCSLKSLFT